MLRVHAVTIALSREQLTSTVDALLAELGAGVTCTDILDIVEGHVGDGYGTATQDGLGTYRHCHFNRILNAHALFFSWTWKTKSLRCYLHTRLFECDVQQHTLHSMTNVQPKLYLFSSPEHKVQRDTTQHILTFLCSTCSATPPSISLRFYVPLAARHHPAYPYVSMFQNSSAVWRRPQVYCWTPTTRARALLVCCSSLLTTPQDFRAIAYSSYTLVQYYKGLNLKQISIVFSSSF